MRNFKSFLIFLLVSTASFAGKQYDLDIVVRDIFSNEILSNCPVRVIDGDNSIQQISDENGKVHFESLTKKVVAVTISVKNGNYQELNFSIKLLKNGKINFKAYLYPSGLYKNQLTLEEDSLYGVRDSVTDYKNLIDLPEYTDTKFQGGKEDLLRWIVENIIYPEYSIEVQDQGRVFLSFVVEIDGSISHIEIFRGVSMSLDQESIRLVRSMPNWEPAKYKGEPVRTIARLPFVFYLN